MNVKKNKTTCIDAEFDSFINIESEVDQRMYNSDGFATLIDAEIKDLSDLPVPVRNNIDCPDEIIVIESKMNGNDIKFLVNPSKSSKQYNYVMDWIDSDKIADLCGESVPVTKICDNHEYYFFPEFLANKTANMNELKNDLDRPYFEYNGLENRWEYSDKAHTLKNINAYLAGVISMFLSIGSLSILVSVFELYVHILIFVLTSVLLLIVLWGSIIELGDRYDKVHLFIYNISDKIIEKFLE